MSVAEYIIIAVTILIVLGMPFALIWFVFKMWKKSRDK